MWNARPAAAALLLSAVMGCARTLPPPAMPAQTVPTVALGSEPPPGGNRVILDAQEGPSRVDRVVGTQTWLVTTRYGAYTVPQALTAPLCTTPCVVTLPQGTHRLQFTLANDSERVSGATVDVLGGPPTVVRTALGTNRPRGWASTLGTLGITFGLGMIIGGLVWGGVTADDRTGDWNPGAIALAVGGGVLTGGSIATWAAFPSIRQEGATTQFPLPSADDAASAGSARGATPPAPAAP